MTETVVSRDGTVIGYDRYGTGSVVILVGGAFQHRAIDQPTATLAELLAARHTVLHYDRRGRGDSGDTAPYAPQREVEDLAALIAATGGLAALYGLSSGGCSLDAAASGLPVTALALYEPPLRIAGDGVAEGYLDRLRAALAAGDRAGAVRTFVTEAVGLPARRTGGRPVHRGRADAGLRRRADRRTVPRRPDSAAAAGPVGHHRHARAGHGRDRRHAVHGDRGGRRRGGAAERGPAITRRAEPRRRPGGARLCCWSFLPLTCGNVHIEHTFG